uniref:Lung adenoma susceptibility protein 2 n=1 Tax=Poecilia formosa TaxID=48698 RepID=A0A096M8L6_POEFO
MESSSLGSDCLSPESTVTSLLSRSGHLRSGLQPAGRSASATFRFRDQDFESASAALDAYIADFDRSCQQCRSLTASLVLPRSQPANHRTARNRDVLRERLTDWELDFLSLPVSSLHHRQNRDRVSMTTEELLSIPCDGSLPVTHTSAFIRGILCRSQGSEPVPSCARSRLGSSHVAHQHRHLDPEPPDQNQNRFPARTSRSRGKLQTDRLSQSADIPASAHRAADLHLPHWLTSNKSVLGCSEVSSLPDLTYPSWVLRAAEPPPWEERGDAPPGAARGRAPSWVLDLEKDGELKAAPAQLRGRSKCVVQAEGEQTLRELRLQLAEHISALTAEGNGSGGLAAPFRVNRRETINIRNPDECNDKFEPVGGDGVCCSTCCVNDSGGNQNKLASLASVSPVGTEDLLRSSPLRCSSSSLTSGATELESDQTLLDEEALSSGYHGNDTCTQPGPVEAMKQMLFRLQAVEAELQRQRIDANGQKTPEKQEADVDPELQSFPGSPSLKRVGLYLNRLKMLVEDPGQRGRRTDSSSSQQDSS